jgi:rhodanese-related sulfurtransferase
MLYREKTHKHIARCVGIPVGLALLLLAGGFWAGTPVSRADETTGSYDADTHAGIWVPPMNSSTDITKPPWDDAWNSPFDQSKEGALISTAMEPKQDLTDSQIAEMKTIETLKRDGIGFLTAAALQERMKSSRHSLMVIDVGAKSAYLHQHILGAINIPENQIGALAPVVLPDLQAPIVTYCGSTQCTASIGAARRFKALGYAEVYDFWGGLKEWVAMGLPTRGSEVAGK